MNNPEFIYVATRLTDKNPIKYLENLQASIDAAVEIYRKGHYPLIPGMDYLLYMNLRGDFGLGDTIPYRMGLRQLKACDSILIENGLKDSSGVQIEKEMALEWGLKIYNSQSEIEPSNKKPIREPEFGEHITQYIKYVKSITDDFPYLAIFNESKLMIYEDKATWRGETYD